MLESCPDGCDNSRVEHDYRDWCRHDRSCDGITHACTNPIHQQEEGNE